MIVPRSRFCDCLTLAVLGLLVFGSLGGCMKAPDPLKMSGGATSVPQSDPELVVTAPSDWTVTEPQHSFYLNTWELPGGGVANISFFGDKPSIVQDNLTRWVNQFQNADGTPVETAENFSLNDAPMETQMIFVEGTLVSTAQIGGGEARENWMLIGAVIEAPHGQLYVKVIGPRDGLHQQMGAVQQMLRDLRVK